MHQKIGPRDLLINGQDYGSGMVVTTDSDWAGLHALTGETRSRSGVTVYYNGMPIYWKSCLQTSRALSSGEAEVVALSDALKAGLHVKYIAEEIGIDMLRLVLRARKAESAG